MMITHPHTREKCERILRDGYQSGTSATVCENLDRTTPGAYAAHRQTQGAGKTLKHNRDTLSPQWTRATARGVVARRRSLNRRVWILEFCRRVYW